MALGSTRVGSKARCHRTESTRRWRLISGVLARVRRSAEDDRLGVMYRLLSDLSMPHFGATVFQVAPDSNLQKITIAFGDSAFHLGWAELIAGWLLLLCDVQLTTAVSSGVFAVDHATLAVYQSYAREVASSLGNGRRCYVEEMDGRFLFHNWRRTASGSPKRILL